LNINKYIFIWDTSEHERTEFDVTWQPVLGTEFKFHVYSAYYDDRLKPNIRIVAIAHSEKPNNVSCIFTFINDWKLKVPAYIERIHGYHGLPYSACFIVCPLENDDIPDYVQIVPNKTVENIGNKLKVLNKPGEIIKMGTFAVCVPPIFDYNYGFELLEFIEFYRMMGAEHFIFYNVSMSSSVRCMLKKYSREGLVTALPWKMNLTSNGEITSQGIVAALNDCVYRYMYR